MNMRKPLKILFNIEKNEKKEKYVSMMLHSDFKTSKNITSNGVFNFSSLWTPDYSSNFELSFEPSTDKRIPHHFEHKMSLRTSKSNHYLESYITIHSPFQRVYFPQSILWRIVKMESGSSRSTLFLSVNLPETSLTIQGRTSDHKKLKMTINAKNNTINGSLSTTHHHFSTEMVIELIEKSYSLFPSYDWKQIRFAEDESPKTDLDEIQEESIHQGIGKQKIYLMPYQRGFYLLFLRSFWSRPLFRKHDSSSIISKMLCDCRFFIHVTRSYRNIL